MTARRLRRVMAKRERANLVENPGAVMMDLAVRATHGMLITADAEAKKPGATPAGIVQALANQFHHAKRDLRKQAHTLFRIEGPTFDEIVERACDEETAPGSPGDHEEEFDGR